MDTSVLNPTVNLGRGAIRHELARRLLGEIVTGLLPAGKRLAVLELAARFGASSTPVRESLIELEGIGVVEFIHNRGVIVKPFGPVQLREIYVLRRILETEAARLACGKMDKEQLSRFKEELLGLAKRRNSRSWQASEMNIDRNLHKAIAQSCGNARLAAEIERYDALVQTTSDVIGFNRRSLIEATEQHLAIVDALLAEDSEAAAAAMSSHIDRIGQTLESAMLLARG